MAHDAHALVVDEGLAHGFGVQAFAQFHETEATGVEGKDRPVRRGDGERGLQFPVTGFHDEAQPFEFGAVARVQQLLFDEVLAETHGAADGGAHKAHGLVHQHFGGGLLHAEGEETHPAPEEAQLLGDAIALQGNEVRRAVQQGEEEALGRGRGLEDEAVVGVVAVDHHDAILGGFHQHIGDGLQLRGRGGVAAGIAGEIEKGLDLARLRPQCGPEAFHIEAALSVVEGVGGPLALQAHLEDLFVVVPVEIREDERLAGAEEEVRRQAQRVADARAHGWQRHGIHARVFRLQLGVPGFAGAIPALDGGIEEGILGRQALQLLRQGRKGERIAGTICDLADGGVDGAARGLARLKGDPLGEEGPAPEGAESLQHCGLGGPQSFIAFGGLGMDAHGSPDQASSLTEPHGRRGRGRWIE